MKLTINFNDAFKAKYNIASVDELDEFIWTFKDTRRVVNARYYENKKAKEAEAAKQEVEAKKAKKEKEALKEEKKAKTKTPKRKHKKKDK